MGKLKVVLNSAGVRGLLRSAEMKAVMEARAAEIKSRAGCEYSCRMRNPERQGLKDLKRLEMA